MLNCIIQTCLLEKSYNSYYGKVLHKLGFFGQDFTQNLYAAFFDILSGQITKFSDKQLVKFSKLVADCLLTGATNFKFFKYLQVDSLSKQTLQLTKLVLK